MIEIAKQVLVVTCGTTYAYPSCRCPTFSHSTVMLTGVHPFDMYGDATDDELEQNVKNGVGPSLRGSRITSHLSWHAIDLLEKLIERDPAKRMTAIQLLENPWVQGKTARQQKRAST